jgi:hypothetical protein
MKKKNYLALVILILTLLLSNNIFAQETPKPLFMTVTTLHRNLDVDKLDTDRKNWNKPNKSISIKLPVRMT